MDLREYKPESPNDFVGSPQKKWAKLLLGSVQLVKEGKSRSLKVLLKGPPGVGKTSMAGFLARQLVSDPFRHTSIITESGADIDIDWVRNLKDMTRTVPMGGYMAIIVDEADLLPKKCRDLFLHVMDTLPKGYLVCFTSNLDNLEKRFEDRCYQVRLDNPSPNEISEWLRTNTTLSEGVIRQLSKIKGVRSTFNQAQSCITAGEIK